MIEDNNHGASVDLNAGKLGGVQAWCDDSRDFLNFVSHVLPGIKAAEARGEDASWHLKWTSAEAGAEHKVQVIGMGHSFGGNGLVQAAHARPDLFKALFLVDPMVPPQIVPEADGLAYPAREFPLTAVTIRRRANWPSREAAREANRNSPFFSTWDKSMFELWVSHGLVPVDPGSPDGEVTLSTPYWCEAAVFTEPTDVGRGWDKFALLPMPVGTLMAKEPNATLGEPNTHEMVWRPPLARTERLLDAGHLVSSAMLHRTDTQALQENPKATADAVWRFLTTLDSGEWGVTPAEIRSEWKLLATEELQLPTKFLTSAIPVRSQHTKAKL